MWWMKRLMKVILRWFSHIGSMENDKIAKRVNVEICVGSPLIGRLRKRWIDSLNDCLKKWGLNVGQPRRMVYDRDEWRGFVRGNFWGIARGMNPWLWRDAKVGGCRSYMKWVEGFLWPSLQLRGIKGKLLFSLILYFCFSSPIPLPLFLAWCVLTPRWRDTVMDNKIFTKYFIKVTLNTINLDFR